MNSATETFIVSFVCLVAICACVLFAYNGGYFDALVGKITMYMLKGKAMAEKQKLQAQGLKAGRDFSEGQLPGNQQAQAVANGLGSGIGGIGSGVGDIGSGVGSGIGSGVDGLKKQL